MIESSQYISCPDCSTRIPFDPQELIKGTRFGCPNCSISIGIERGSRETVKDALDKLEELKREVGKT